MGCAVNIEAIALTALIALGLFAACVAVASRMTWAVEFESRIFRAISRRNDARTYQSVERDE